MVWEPIFPGCCNFYAIDPLRKRLRQWRQRFLVIELFIHVNPRPHSFWSNMNPDVSPRLLRSRATARRVGELGRRPTLMLNGYADQVAHLYVGMGPERDVLAGSGLQDQNKQFACGMPMCAIVKI